MLSSPEKASSHRSLSSPDRMWQDTLGCRRVGNGLPQAPCIPGAAARADMSSFFKVGSLKSKHSSPPGKKERTKARRNSSKCQRPPAGEGQSGLSAFNTHILSFTQGPQWVHLVTRGGRCCQPSHTKVGRTPHGNFLHCRTFSIPLSLSCLEPQNHPLDKCVVNTHYTEGS